MESAAGLATMVQTAAMAHVDGNSGGGEASTVAGGTGGDSHGLALSRQPGARLAPAAAARPRSPNGGRSKLLSYVSEPPASLRALAVEAEAELHLQQQAAADDAAHQQLGGASFATLPSLIDWRTLPENPSGASRSNLGAEGGRGHSFTLPTGGGSAGAAAAAAAGSGADAAAAAAAAAAQPSWTSRAHMRLPWLPARGGAGAGAWGEAQVVEHPVAGDLHMSEVAAAAHTPATARAVALETAAPRRRRLGLGAGQATPRSEGGMRHRSVDTNPIGRRSSHDTVATQKQQPQQQQQQHKEGKQTRGGDDSSDSEDEDEGDHPLVGVWVGGCRFFGGGGARGGRPSLGGAGWGGAGWRGSCGAWLLGRGCVWWANSSMLHACCPAHYL